MNNNLFIHRAEIILTTMRAISASNAGNRLTIAVKQVAKWLNVADHVAASVIAKMCNIGILGKKGAGRSTEYYATDVAKNSIKSYAQGRSESEAITHVIKWFLEKKPTKEVNQFTTTDGRRLIKVEAREKLSEESQHAIDTLMIIIKDNETLKAENELLREEVERLKEYEEKYKQIKSLIK